MPGAYSVQVVETLKFFATRRACVIGEVSHGIADFDNLLCREF